MLRLHDSCTLKRMIQKSILLSLLILSLVLSTPSLMRIPRMLPFLHADVREAAPKALDMLRSEGLWLVNIDLRKIERTAEGICFEWEHHYTSRETKGNPEILSTCIDAPEA